MWRAKQDSHKTFIESLPGPSGQNKLQKQSVMVREAFWCRSVKNTAYSVVLIGKHCHQSPSTWTVNLLDMIVQLSSHPNPQILTSGRIYIYVYVPFKSRPQETLNQPCLEPFFSSYKPECKEAKCLGAFTPTSTHTCAPLLRRLHSQTHPAGRAGNGCCQALARKRCLRQSALSSWALIYARALLNATQQRVLWSWALFPMHGLLLTCFKNISTGRLLLSLHYIIVWYIGKHLLLNE